MRRRKFIAQIIQPANNQEAPPPPGGGITPYTGVWTTDQVIHMLKRTQFGARPEDIQYFAARTFSQAIDEMLNPTALAPAPPVKDYVPSVNVLK